MGGWYRKVKEAEPSKKRLAKEAKDWAVIGGVVAGAAVVVLVAGSMLGVEFIDEDQLIDAMVDKGIPFTE